MRILTNEGIVKVSFSHRKILEIAGWHVICLLIGRKQAQLIHLILSTLQPLNATSQLNLTGQNFVCIVRGCVPST